MKVKKQIKQDINIYTLYNLVEVLYPMYKPHLTKQLEKKFKALYDELNKEVTKDYIRNADITECDLYEMVEFKTYK